MDKKDFYELQRLCVAITSGLEADDPIAKLCERMRASERAVIGHEAPPDPGSLEATFREIEEARGKSRGGQLNASRANLNQYQNLLDDMEELRDILEEKWYLLGPKAKDAWAPALDRLIKKLGREAEQDAPFHRISL